MASLHISFTCSEVKMSGKKVGRELNIKYSRSSRAEHNVFEDCTSLSHGHFASAYLGI
jgi:hypothetical protein